MNAIGYVLENELGDNARIKVLAIKNGKGYIQDEDYIMENCPPEGLSFAPSFFNRGHSCKKREFIKFSLMQNERDTGDQTIIDHKKAVKPIGYEVIEVVENPVQQNHINQETLDTIKIEGTKNFYLKYQNQLYGSFKVKSDKIVPSKGKEVKCWKLTKEEVIITYEQQQIILAEPKSEPIAEIDCMTSTQLADWFNEKIYASLSPFVKEYASSKSKFRQELDKLFNTTVGDKLQDGRFKRVIHGLSKLELGRAQIIELANTSEKFQSLYEQVLLSLKAEFATEVRAEYAEIKKEQEKEVTQIKKIQKNEEKKLEQIKKGAEKLNNQIRFLKDKQEELNDKKKALESDVEFLEKNEQKLITEFKIKAKLFPQPPIQTIHSVPIATAKSFVLESYLPDETTLYEDKKAFYKALENNLINQGEYYKILPKRILEHLTHFNCFFIKNTKVAKAILQSVNNCHFIIQQVEADWLKFSQFWKNGLGAIWESSIKNPDRLHFLVLQDVNLASPICYARPLLDLNANIRNVLPYANTPFPPNLRILAAKLSADYPEDFGLPIHQQSFENWGGLGFADVIDKEISDYQQDKYLELGQLEKWDDSLGIGPVSSLSNYFE